MKKQLISEASRRQDLQLGHNKRLKGLLKNPLQTEKHHPIVILSLSKGDSCTNCYLFQLSLNPCPIYKYLT